MANFNFNKVIMGGRMTADAELKQTQNGTSVTTFSIAVNRRYSKDAQQNIADFFNVTAWRQTAEFVSQYFKKGSSICIVGTLQNRSWTDQQGQKHYATDIIADEVMFVDSKSDNAQNSQPNYNLYQQAQPNFEEMKDDDDLPF